MVADSPLRFLSSPVEIARYIAVHASRRSVRAVINESDNVLAMMAKTFYIIMDESCAPAELCRHSFFQ